MEKHHEFSIWYVLIAIWIVFIFHNMLSQMFAIERIPYSEFVKALQDEKVIEVAVAQDRIQGKMKTSQDGQEVEKAFSTVRVDPELSELLEKLETKDTNTINRRIESLRNVGLIKEKGEAKFGGRRYIWLTDNGKKVAGLLINIKKI